jgi:hypothetical protein
MNTGYLIYQAERPRSAAEQRQTDIAHAELARAVSRRWHALTAPLRARHHAGRRAGLPAGYRATEYRAAQYRAAEYRAAEYQAAEYQAAEYQAAEGVAAECLSGRTA